MAVVVEAPVQLSSLSIPKCGRVLCCWYVSADNEKPLTHAAQLVDKLKAENSKLLAENK